MRSLPLRLRLTLAFAAAMALVLAATGTLLYVRLGQSLLDVVDERLLARAQVIAESAGDGDVLTRLSGEEDQFAQVLDAEGDVVAASPGYPRPLLPPGRLRSAAEEPQLLRTLVSPPGEDDEEPARLLALALGGEGGTVLTGSLLDDREDALELLLAQLLIGGPLALVLASTAGYVLAGAALRPVEVMRRRAERVSAENSGERLPLTEARDEVRRLGETLNAMLDRLDAGLRRERRFVADASHELRTPLALLQTELELALRRPRTPAEMHAALRSAGEDVDRLTRLAEDLLVLASAEHGRLPIRRSSLDVEDLLGATAARFAGRVGSDRITVEASSGMTVEADRLRLEQALANLVDNAVRHGGGTVTLDAAREDGKVVLTVTDRGPGFPPEFLPHAFEPFSQGQESRSAGGAGLGLAIVHAVAEAHGGTVRARNRADGGARVEIALPA